MSFPGYQGQQHNQRNVTWMDIHECPPRNISICYVCSSGQKGYYMHKINKKCTVSAIMGMRRCTITMKYLRGGRNTGYDRVLYSYGENWAFFCRDMRHKREELTFYCCFMAEWVWWIAKEWETTNEVIIFMRNLISSPFGGWIKVSAVQHYQDRFEGFIQRWHDINNPAPPPPLASSSHHPSTSAPNILSPSNNTSIRPPPPPPPPLYHTSTTYHRSSYHASNNPSTTSPTTYTTSISRPYSSRRSNISCSRHRSYGYNIPTSNISTTTNISAIHSPSNILDSTPHSRSTLHSHSHSTHSAIPSPLNPTSGPSITYTSTYKQTPQHFSLSSTGPKSYNTTIGPQFNTPNITDIHITDINDPPRPVNPPRPANITNVLVDEKKDEQDEKDEKKDEEDEKAVWICTRCKTTNAASDPQCKFCYTFNDQIVQKWSYSRCSFINDADFIQCKICLCNKPAITSHSAPNTTTRPTNRTAPFISVGIGSRDIPDIPDFPMSTIPFPPDDDHKKK